MINGGFDNASTVQASSHHETNVLRKDNPPILLASILGIAAPISEKKDPFLPTTTKYSTT